MTSPVLTVWLRPADPGASAAARRIGSELEKNGVQVLARRPERTLDGLSVVVMADDGGASCDAAQRIRSGAPIAEHDGRMLAVLASASAPSAAQLWNLMNAGADDALWWPADGGAAALAAAQGQAVAQILARLQRWQAVSQLQESSAVTQLLAGANRAWRALVREVVEVAAFTQSPVLITGETGTGKDLVAQLIHRLGGSQGGLTILDCTTLSPELAGSELFGHERGAYTGAQGARDGAFALAHGGTLFLDEVGELPLPLQAQLLRVLQERQYKRIGSNTWQSSQFRLVCATNRDLEAEVARGAFRADLFYRIATWRCRTPPLRERRDDILPLASHFLRQLAPRGACLDFDPAVREFLLAREYPGNVRDLRQTVARIWHRHCGPGPVTIGALPPDERPAGTGHLAAPASVAAAPPSPAAVPSSLAAAPLASAAAPPSLERLFEDAVRQSLAQGHGLARISQTAAETALRIVLEEEGGNNQRAAARLGVTDRALQIRRKARQQA
jgi:transcriptional regulator with GAF, ATPase, and Fis domain